MDFRPSLEVLPYLIIEGGFARFEGRGELPVAGDWLPEGESDE